MKRDEAEQVISQTKPLIYDESNPAISRSSALVIFEEYVDRLMFIKQMGYEKEYDEWRTTEDEYEEAADED